MPKFALVVEYIGINYAGSQIQPDEITIQSELEKALSTLILGGKNPPRIKTIFSGRTDAGVHSKGQVVHFESEKPIVASRFLVYQYKIVNRQHRSAWDVHSLLVREPLDIERMNKALGYLIGEHDFTSFKSTRTENPAKVCNVYKADCIKNGDIITVEIVANRFLYNMVRTIVGTLLMIEHNKFEPEFMQQILEAKDRTKAGPTISPDGLTLMTVGYKPYCQDYRSND